ncbi:MAG: hypothetical protein JWQ87_2246 [Candidatus Sulfotelmatobacter sp.]|nr:hypothetical protein [Candidatus Sulfotelmatobacter sp.]
MPDKKEVSKHSNVTGITGLSGKSITAVDVWRNGAVDVVEINYTGGPYFIKFRTAQVEVGGDANWGTGTVVAG